MDKFIGILEEQIMIDLINEERSQTQKDAMERDYKALKSIHRITGKFIPLSKMDGLRYSVNNKGQHFHLIHDSIGVDHKVSFDDVNHHAGIGTHEFADFLNRHGARQVDYNGKDIPDHLKFAPSRVASSSNNQNGSKSWKQVGPNGFWKLVDA